MKKIATIFYLSLLLFTTAGYRLLVNYLEHREQQNLQVVIEEKSYNPDHLIEVSVDLNLPYLSDWQNWEFVEGMVTIEGTPYQYVERILKAGKMVYRCLPNNGIQEAISARDRFMQLSYDFTHPAGQKSPLQTGVSIKPPLPELFCFEADALSHPIGAEMLIPFLPQPFMAISKIALAVPTPPPNRA